MNRLLGLNITRFIGLMLFQLFILNEIDLHNFINPYIYPLIILLMPRTLKPWMLMLLSFFVGILIDGYSNTLGIHASACVFLAFIRPAVLQLVQPRLGYNDIEDPGSAKLGFQWFISYAFICILLHHIFYFSVEAWGFSNLPQLGMRILSSFLVSMLMVILYRLFFKTKIFDS